MELEKQVCSFGVSKRLKALGVTQESLFWWFRIWDNTYELGDSLAMFERGKQMSSLSSTDARPIFDTSSAFTASELGKLLPEYVDAEKR